MRSQRKKVVRIVSLAFFGALLFAMYTNMIGLNLDSDQVFDCTYYRENYDDLNKAFGQDCGALKNHWRSFGISEMRQAHPFFSVRDYLALYPDLAAVFSGKPVDAVRHYLTHGLREGRSGTVLLAKSVFVCGHYTSAYPDVAGLSCEEAKRQWITDGIRQFRTASPIFAVSEYLKMFPDLNKHYANRPEIAVRHFVLAGRAEGRAGRFALRSHLFNCKDYAVLNPAVAAMSVV